MSDVQWITFIYVNIIGLMCSRNKCTHICDWNMNISLFYRIHMGRLPNHQPSHISENRSWALVTNMTNVMGYFSPHILLWPKSMYIIPSKRNGADMKWNIYIYVFYDRKKYGRVSIRGTDNVSLEICLHLHILGAAQNSSKRNRNETQSAP